ncbi:hypothetical protein B0H63DRAFT_556158 [Podospora didyma]|uniref:Ubiquitin 3 binding protein But2 C-terminal domain-containing protein n=1 Tax=Podospora didyma TaxID=330526 RepID=A0AAE0U8U2_9PEZI|nr:hypothetical protein B0H63DRAFT_556158 [Podospora didyma]
MKSTTLASVLSLGTLAFAAPTANAQRWTKPNDTTPQTWGNSTTSTNLTQTGTTTTSSSPYSVTQTVLPSLQVKWDSKHPDAPGRDSTYGHLLTTPSERVDTAVSFVLTEEQAAGKTCKLVFRLGQNDWAVPSPSGGDAKLSVYRVNANCLNDDYTWNNRPPVGALAGIITPAKGKDGEWEKVDMSADTWEPKMGAAPIWSCSAGDIARLTWKLFDKLKSDQTLSDTKFCRSHFDGEYDDTTGTRPKYKLKVPPLEGSRADWESVSSPEKWESYVEEFLEKRKDDINSRPIAMFSSKKVWLINKSSQIDELEQ